MQGWIRPEGEHGASTYWWRRFLVVIIAAALVGAVYLLARPSPKEPEQPKPEAAATPTQASSPPPPTTAPAATAPAAPAACDPKSLKLNVSVPEKITPGKDVPLTLSVTNVGSAPCQVELTPKTFALVLSRDRDIIWSSTDCERRLGKLPSGLLAPQQGSEWSTKWPGKKAGEGCALSDDVLASGAYQFAATIVGGPSVQQRITIN